MTTSIYRVWKFEGYICLFIFYIIPFNYTRFMNQTLIFGPN